MPFPIDDLIDRALAEDVGTGDLTSTLLIHEDDSCAATIVAKEAGILAGLPFAERVFARLTSEFTWQAAMGDGDLMGHGDVLVRLAGRTRAILTGERVALNILQRASGIATATRQYVDAVRPFKAKILDTRKTAPGLRALDKYAVRAGGGSNHRFGLYDGILIKDNHIRAAGGMRQALTAAQQHASPMVKIEIEVDTLAQVEEALDAGAHIILLDNMTVGDMADAVARIDRRALVEASGGVTLANVRDIAAAGVDYISVGALTHSVKAIDLSLEMVDA